MWRLSPFPSDADRPLRGVFVYASHAIEQHLKSWTFWLMLGMMAMLMVVPCLASVVIVPMRLATETPDVVVVADPELREVVEQTLKSQPARWDLRESPPDDPDITVLTLDGKEVAGMTAHLRATTEVDRAERRSYRLIHRIRQDVLVDGDTLAALQQSRPEEDQDRLETVTEMIGPISVGMFLFLGVISGAGAATELARSRDEEYFNVLRLGTPVSVIFLGGLIERALLTLVWALPMAMMAFAMLGLSSLSSLLLHPEEAFTHLVILPLMALWAGLTTFAICSGGGAIAGSLTRGNRTLRAGGQIAPIFLILLAPLGFRALMDPSADPSAWLFLPGLGLAYAASGIGAGLPLGWAAASAIVQGLWGAAGLRLGTWAYELDETPIEFVRRRLWTAR